MGMHSFPLCLVRCQEFLVRPLILFFLDVGIVIYSSFQKIEGANVFNYASYDIKHIYKKSNCSYAYRLVNICHNDEFDLK